MKELTNNYCKAINPVVGHYLMGPARRGTPIITRKYPLKVFRPFI